VRQTRLRLLKTRAGRNKPAASLRRRSRLRLAGVRLRVAGVEANPGDDVDTLQLWSGEQLVPCRDEAATEVAR
jgi:hypothetical protein